MHSTAETAEASPDTGDDGNLGSRPGVLASVVTSILVVADMYAGEMDWANDPEAAYRLDGGFLDYPGIVLLDFLA